MEYKKASAIVGAFYLSIIVKNESSLVYPPDQMAMYQVSDLVNSPRNYVPECILPIKL